MTFTTHITYHVEADLTIVRREGHLPSIVKLPALSVTVSPSAGKQATATLLRRLADELEGSSL